MSEEKKNNWRNKAGEAFALALRLRDRQTKKTMLAIASSYASLSQRAETSATEVIVDVEVNPTLTTPPKGEDFGSLE